MNVDDPNLGHARTRDRLERSYRDLVTSTDRAADTPHQVDSSSVLLWNPLAILTNVCHEGICDRLSQSFERIAGRHSPTLGPAASRDQRNGGVRRTARDRPSRGGVPSRSIRLAAKDWLRQTRRRCREVQSTVDMSLRRKPKPRDRSSRTASELEAFTAQARWIIEYHDRRGESLSTRAVALMGFTGVILALLSRSNLPGDAVANAWVTGLTFTTVALLLLTAYFCLRTLLPGEASAPAAEELRKEWNDWVRNSRRGKALGSVADSYLMAADPDIPSPVNDALNEANRKAEYFRNAGVAMLAALTSLAGLLLSVYSQVV